MRHIHLRRATPPASAPLRTLLCALAFVACGGRDAPAPAPAAAPPPEPAPQAAPQAAAPASGATHDVKMLGDARGYRFEPANVTINTGDAVRRTPVSGGPHNASFWADSAPAGTAARLGARMPNTSSPLVGPLLLDPNATYTVSFAGLRPGVYRYYCTPHLALGMTGTVTVVK